MKRERIRDAVIWGIFVGTVGIVGIVAIFIVSHSTVTMEPNIFPNSATVHSTYPQEVEITVVPVE